MERDRISPSSKVLVQYMFGGGIYTPKLYYIMLKMPMATQNIQRDIPGEGSLHHGENVQFVYPYRSTLLTPP